MPSFGRELPLRDYFEFYAGTYWNTDSLGNNGQLGFVWARTEDEAWKKLKLAWPNLNEGDYFLVTQVFVKINGKDRFMMLLQAYNPLDGAFGRDGANIFQFEESPRATGINSTVEKKGAVQRGVSLKKAGSVVSTKTELALLVINLLNNHQYQRANNIWLILQQLNKGQITPTAALAAAAKFEKVL